MQGIRKLTYRGCELSVQLIILHQISFGLALLELEELGRGVLELEQKAAPNFEREVHRVGELASAAADFHMDGRRSRPGCCFSSLRSS